MGFELVGNGAFKYFRQKREIGDGSVVVEDVRIQTRFWRIGVTEASLRARGTEPVDREELITERRRDGGPGDRP